MSDTKPFHLRDSDAPEEDDTDDVIELGHFADENSFKYSNYVSNGKGLRSFAQVTDDGRITINLDLRKELPHFPAEHARDVKEFAVDPRGSVPSLNILILIVGSRGDVQPFVALGKRLLGHGHRVRIGTHEAFRDFVKDAGLGFYSIGGNPQDLMSYMVKNPGLIPGWQSLTNGDIGKKRKMLAEMISGCWSAAIEPDDDSGTPFAADAIISNPPAFAHVHIAERLGVPLLLSFTMPWSPTESFPHPLVNIQQSNAENGLTNYLSYGFADLITWQGMGDLVNDFRTKKLGINPLSLRSGAGLVDRLKIPWTYCLSPTLIPKPQDWKNHIDVVGFYFMDQDTGFKPAPELAAFLDEGPPPVYIGFGSVVVEDSAKMTQLVFDAVKKANVRALVSAGWGGLGGTTVPENVFILGKDVPHDWLFTKVSSVVHHGGAGTTAIGLRLGKPTLIVPFFGDQPFWGSMVAKAGAGPDPIHHKALNVDNLAAAIAFCQTTKAKKAAEKMGQEIRDEDGVRAGVDSFHRHLPLLNMRCDLDPSRVAVWYWNDQLLKLSAFAAQVLVDSGKLELSKLVAHRSKEYDSHKMPTDPVSGGVTEILRTITNYYSGIAQIFVHPVRGIVNTTVAIPQGVIGIVGSVHDGFKNLPTVWGSEVRPTGKIDNFEDGMKEAGKGFFYGYYDGIKGLVKDPIDGAKKEGFLGAIKGSARSFANVSLLPAAGGLGLVVHPTRGLWASMTKKWTPDKQRTTFETRKAEGLDAVKGASNAEKDRVLAAFEHASKDKERRKQRLGQEAAEALTQPEIVGDGSESEGSTKVASRDEASSSTSSDTTVKGDDSPPAYPDHEEMSPEERRGYERGLQEAARKLGKSSER